MKYSLLFTVVGSLLISCESTRDKLHIPQDPPMRASEELFNTDDTETLGLPLLEGEHALLYKATKDGYKFCHHPNLVVFQNQLHAMWSNGLVGEDENGQRILHSSSADGVTWTTPVVLAEDPDGPSGPFACVAAGFHVAGETLVAYNTAIMAGDPLHPNNALYARTSIDAKNWGLPQRLPEGFFIESPRTLPSGRLLITGQFADGQPRLMYTDSPDGVTSWKDGAIPHIDSFRDGRDEGGNRTYAEPNWFRRPDGSVVMLFRTRSAINQLWASVSKDNGASWSQAVPTNFLDSTARFSAGNLPNGTAFVINNPGAKRNPRIRNPLTLALSSDGITFDRGFIIRGGPTSMRFEGIHKLDGWQYPSAVTWQGYLYIVYSINKEDVGVTRVALEKLQP